MSQSLKNKYKENIVPILIKEFNYKNIHEVPKIIKITLNRGLGEAAQNTKFIESSLNELSKITGQKPIVTKSKKSISGFKLRENMPIGIKVTLRKEKMYTFLEKLINLSLPRIKDFRGINPQSFDGCGNYSFGIKEQLIFPEISYEEVEKIRGLDISIITSAKTDRESFSLLKLLGMPFKE